VVPRRLLRQSLVPHIDSLLAETLFSLFVKVVPDSRLRGALLINPETNVIREPRVVHTRGEKGILDNVDVNAVLGGFEEAS